MNKLPRILITICLMVGLVAMIGCEAITGGPTDSGNGGTPPTSSPTTIRVIADETVAVPLGFAPRFEKVQTYYVHLYKPGVLRWTIKEISGKYIYVYLFEWSEWTKFRSGQNAKTIYVSNRVVEQNYEIPLSPGEYCLWIAALDGEITGDRIVSVYLEVES